MLTPPRNPFGGSEFRAFQWVVDAVLELGRGTRLVDSHSENNLRQLNGSLDNMANMIEQIRLAVAGIDSTVLELSRRATHQTDAANLSVSGSATTAPFPVSSRSFSFPAPEGVSRSAILIFSCEYSSNSTTVQANIFPEVLLGSSRVWAGEAVGVPQMLSAPSGWTMTSSGFAAVRIPSDTEPTFTFRMHRVGFQSSPTTITAGNIQAVLMYGDKY